VSKILIRPATTADVPAIVDLAVESVSVNPLPVRLDRQAMGDTARALIIGNQHFSWVSVKGGRVVGAVGACVQPGFWFQRSQASVLMFFAHAGGIELLRELARWVRARPTIKVAVFSLEPGMDPRIGHLLSRLGFGRQSIAYTYVRGA
jgi:hypothetical protein